MTLLQKIDRIPPFICRIMARTKDGRKPLSYSEIAKLSGVKRSSVAVILTRKSWNLVPIDQADKISAACGVNLCTPGKAMKWLRRYHLAHIRNGNAGQRRMFSRLLKAQG